MRHSSGPKELTHLTNKIFKLCEQKKNPLLTTSLNTNYNDIIGKPSCFTESMPKDPKDAQKVCPGFECWVSVSHVPLLPQQQNCTVFLKEMCIFCSADQVLFTRTYFTTNLKTVTITLFPLLHREDYNQRSSQMSWEHLLSSQARYPGWWQRGVEAQCYCNTSTVVKPAISPFSFPESSASTRKFLTDHSVKGCFQNEGIFHT